MTLWIAWSVLVSALFAIAAVPAERVAIYLGAPRRFVWIGAMIAAAVAPVAIALRPTPTIGRLVSSASPLASPTSVPRRIDALASAEAVFPVARVLGWQHELTTASTIARVADRWVLRAWLLASLTCFVFLGRALARLRRHRRQWSDADTEMGRVLVAQDAGPAVVGFVHPRIVIPAWALGADRSTRGLILRHELEHIRAGDSRALLGIAVLLMIFPWNGALWWMARKLRLAIEIDCDARVVRAVGGAHAYGLMLLAVGERYATALPISACLSEPGSDLEARINAMTAPGQRRPVAASFPFAAIALVVLSTAAWAPRPAPLARPRADVAQSTAQSVAPAAVPLDRARVSDEVFPNRQQESTRIAPAESAGAKRSASPRVSTVPAPLPPSTVETEPPRATTPIAFDPKPLRGNPGPRYPDSLRAAGTEGHVLVRLSTDARGIPDTATIQVVESTHDLFVSAVRGVLPRWRFDSEGSVRLAFSFKTTSGGAGWPRRTSPVLTIDGVAAIEVVIVTFVPSLSTTNRSVPDALPQVASQNTPVERMFRSWLEAFNSADQAQLDEYIQRHMPPSSKEGMMREQSSTGGVTLLEVRRSELLSLEFVVLEKISATMDVGFFAIAAGDPTRVESFRLLRVPRDRSAYDPALLDHLRRMRPD